MSENFLSRWSKRKLEVRAQEKLAEQAQPFVAKEPLAADLDSGLSARSHDVVTSKSKDQLSPQPELPLPTEDDLVAVKEGGDIKAFMVNKVSTELKNKAFKALFSRPEFNVMDGLDIYIDDYNKFTPLSKEDIGKMTLSKQLLSRPDLEIPKKGDIEAGLEKLESALVTPTGAEPAVLDKIEDEDQITPDEVDITDEPRVIPDGLQATDSEYELPERSIESIGKK